MKLKPGVLALIIRAKVTTQNLGKVVTVLEQNPVDSAYWLVRSEHGPLQTMSLMTGEPAAPTRIAYVRGCDLLPIGGKPSAADIADALIQRLPREVNP